MRRLLLVLLAGMLADGGFAGAALGAPVAAGLPTTLSDQWWNAGESGWGAAVLR
jgi:hypothetical protein